MIKNELSLQFIEGHFQPDNVGWISNLRPGLYNDPSKSVNGSVADGRGDDDEDKNKGFVADLGAPSFA